MQQVLPSKLSQNLQQAVTWYLRTVRFFVSSVMNTTLTTAFPESFTALMTVLTFMTCLWSTEAAQVGNSVGTSEMKDWQFKVFRYLVSTSGVFCKKLNETSFWILKLPLGAYTHNQVPTLCYALWWAHSVATSVWEKRGLDVFEPWFDIHSSGCQCCLSSQSSVGNKLSQPMAHTGRVMVHTGSHRSLNQVRKNTNSWI